MKQCMRERLPFPDKIANAPRVILGMELYYDAFWDLHTCRQVGFGVAPIPWTAMREYSLTYGLDTAQEENLFYLIRVMDNAYIDHHDKGKGKSPIASHSQPSKDAWTS